MATSNYYTSAYSGVPDSYGYTSRDSVLSLQHQLNNQYGAKLTPDGTWGPLTDAAYKQYMASGAGSASAGGSNSLYTQANGYNAYPGQAFDYGNYAGTLGAQASAAPTFNYTPAALERLAFNARSDADMQAEAQGLINPTYDRYFQQLEQGLNRNTMISEQQQADLERQKNDLLQQNAAQYDQQRAYLEQSAIARGMGRSSYLTDAQANSQINENAAMQRINENWQYEHQQIADNIARLNEDYNNAKSQGERERMEQIAGQISKLREADRQLGLQIQMYNADQSFREQTINTQMQQMQYENQLAVWKGQQDQYTQSLNAAMQLYAMDRDWASQQAGYQQQWAMSQEQFRQQQALQQEEAARLTASKSSGGGSSTGTLGLSVPTAPTTTPTPIFSGNQWGAPAMEDKERMLYLMAQQQAAQQAR